MSTGARERGCKREREKSCLGREVCVANFKASIACPGCTGAGRNAIKA